MNIYSFPAALHILTPSLDKQTRLWALDKKILDTTLMDVWADQKINWFAGYLFPCMSTFKLDKVMKFFCCLFILDDLLDTMAADESIALLDYLLCAKKENYSVDNPVLFRRADVFFEAATPISEFGNGAWSHTFQTFWYQYLKAQRWEVRNRQAGVIPSFSLYRERRLESSGAYLALHLLKDNFENTTLAVNFLEYKIARIICLGNDVISLDKERKSGDFHNELLLLQHYTGCTPEHAEIYAKVQLRALISEVSTLLEDGGGHFENLGSDELTSWKEELKLLLGGCQFWSQEDTSRYGSVINGHIKFN